MKKLLATSTALVLVAGAAVAEVKVAGDGRMGIIYNKSESAAFGGFDPVTGDPIIVVTKGKGAWNFTSRVRFQFNASGETDGGLSFGGTARLADANGRQTDEGLRGSVFIGGAFGKLSVGDVDSAAEAGVGNLAGGVGLVDAEWDHITYVGASARDSNINGPVALYEYKFGDGAFYASLSDGYTGSGNVKGGESFGVAFKYAFGDYTVAAGYESTKDTNLAGFVSGFSVASVALAPLGANTVADVSQLVLKGDAKFGDFTLSAIYSQYDLKNTGLTILDDAKPRQYGISGVYTFGAAAVTGFYRVADVDVSGIDNAKFYGIGASYDLGGGASVVGGVANRDTGIKSTQASFGVSMKF